MRHHWFALAVLSLLAGGCTWPLSSKWALENGKYAAKYDHPYPKDDLKRYSRMARQAIDARHVEGMSGSYYGMAAQDHPFSVGGEMGYVAYPTSYMEWHAAFAGLVGADVYGGDFGDNAFVGLNLGARTHTPSRLGPFVGVGAFGGVRWYDIIRIVLTDDDDDGFYEETEREDCEMAGLGAVYPEVGIHFWTRSDVRVTASASYYLTTEGRDSDFWFFGFSLARFDDPYYSPVRVRGSDAAELTRLPAP